MRVYHNLSVADAQQVVDAIAEVRIPSVWSDGSVKRVLQPTLKLPDQLLLLIATSIPQVSSAELIQWTEAADKKYFMKILRGFHKKRFIEFKKNLDMIQILPPGSRYVEQLLRKANLSDIFF